MDDPVPYRAEHRHGRDGAVRIGHEVEVEGPLAVYSVAAPGPNRFPLENSDSGRSIVAYGLQELALPSTSLSSNRLLTARWMRVNGIVGNRGGGGPESTYLRRVSQASPPLPSSSRQDVDTVGLGK